MTIVDGLNGSIKNSIEELQAKVPVDAVPYGLFLRDDGVYAAAGGGGGAGSGEIINLGDRLVGAEIFDLGVRI